MKFNDLGLQEFIVKGLAIQGIETATEIQGLTLPHIKSGKDVVGLSQTGSGKTYAFGIPALENIYKELNAVQVLIICPTRELAMQVAGNLRKLTEHTSNISIASVYGGADIDKQIRDLKRGAKIVVGTPGRLMDHLRKKSLKLNELKMIILDEADEMLDMGFKEDIEEILKSVPQSRQTVMFSATMPSEIARLTKQYMRDPITIKTSNQEFAHEKIKQYCVNCKREDKIDVLKSIFKEFNPWVSIVFCNTIQMTEELTKTMKELEIPAVCLNGDMRQSERKRVMDKFKTSSAGGVLVATDVAARGIDIKNVDLVINFDFPNNEDYYVHRIGRTGRAGKEGIAITLISNKFQYKDLQALVSKTGGKVEEYLKLCTVDFGGVQNERKSKPKQTQSKKPDFKKIEPRKTFKTDRDKKKDFRCEERKDFKKKPERKPDFSRDRGVVETYEMGDGKGRFAKPTNTRSNSRPARPSKPRSR